MLQTVLARHRKLSRAFGRFLAPIPPARLRGALQSLVGSAGADILFVHTSLSSCGRFTAGPRDVLAALGEVSSTIAFPTHTFSYPSAAGQPGPVFDPARTPSQSGLLTEMFRHETGVSRSIQATHSIAAEGPDATYLTAGHYLAGTPCGVGTPYSRLIDRHASILMFGVTFHSYTLFHTAEDASNSQYAYEPSTVDRLRVIDEHGRETECPSRRQTRNPRRFKETGDVLEAAGLVRRCSLGRGALLFVPDCARVHDFLLERLKRTPDFLFQTCREALR